MQKLHEILSSKLYSFTFERILAVAMHHIIEVVHCHWSKIRKWHGTFQIYVHVESWSELPRIRQMESIAVCMYWKKNSALYIKANYNKTLKFNRRSELFAKCRHTEKFHAGKFKSVRDRRTRVSKKLCVEHSSIYSMTKHLLYINLAAAGGIFCLHRLSYSSWVNICTCITVLYLPHYSQV